MKTFRLTSEAQWHQLRAEHVGGSEIAALFGEHRQITRFELWHRKAGLLPEPDFSDNERVFWGSVLEPAIAEGVSRKMGWTVRKVRRYFSMRPDLGLGGSLDYEIVGHPKGPGVLEIKTADWLVVRGWEDGEPPLAYELQLQSYLACTGRSWGAIAVLVGGNDLRLFEYERRPKTIATIEAAIGAFWASIDRKEPPAPDFGEDSAAITKLYAGVTAGKTVDLSGSNRVPDLIADYQAGAGMEKQGKATREAAKAEILTLIGDAEVAICGTARISAKQIAGGHIEYDRKPYRDFRVHEKKAAAA